MLKMWTILAVFLFLAGPSAVVFADVIKRNDGTTVEGLIVSETEKLIQIQTFDGVITVKTSDVLVHLKRKSPYEEYQEQLKKIQAGDPKTYLQAAVWCLEHRLWTLTRQHLDDARKALPREGAAELEQKIKDVADTEKKERNTFLGLDPLKITIGCRDELDEAETGRIVAEVQNMSRLLQSMTGGVMYVETITVNLGSEKGDMVYLKGFDDVAGAGGRAIDGAGFIAAKRWSARTLLHEYGHAHFYLKDEYNTTSLGAPTAEPSCPSCIMGDEGMEFCKKSNHKGSRNAPGCQDLLAKMFPRLVEGFARTTAETKEIMKQTPEAAVITVVHPRKK